MPRKWVIFQIVAGLAILVSILMIGGILLPHPNKSQEGSDSSISFAMIIGFITVMIFSVLYTFILQSRFPDKYISPFLRISFIATGIISILFLVFCLIGVAAVIKDNIMLSKEVQNSKALYFAISTECLCLIIMISFLCSLRVTKIITRAHRTSVSAVIDSLGNISS
jgi:hypothetical protein